MSDRVNEAADELRQVLSHVGIGGIDTLGMLDAALAAERATAAECYLCEESDDLPMIHAFHDEATERATAAVDVERLILEGPEFGRVFGKVMQQHPTANIRHVNAVLRIVAAELARTEAEDR